VGTETAVALREEAFGIVGTKLLVARYQPANVASGRIMARLGMTVWGDRPGPGDRPVRVCLLDRTSWENDVAVPRAAGAEGLIDGSPGISQAHRADRQRREDAP
jgi:hypothetical protein